jgi:hypothetical protein
VFLSLSPSSNRRHGWFGSVGGGWQHRWYSLQSRSLRNSASAATLTPISPFTGDFSDDFNRFSNVQAVQVLDVFSNHGVIRNLTSGGAIKVEFSSQLNGDLVVPISG